LVIKVFYVSIERSLARTNELKGRNGDADRWVGDWVGEWVGGWMERPGAVLCFIYLSDLLKFFIRAHYMPPAVQGFNLPNFAIHHLMKWTRVQAAFFFSSPESNPQSRVSAYRAAERYRIYVDSTSKLK
jgi:hypothetical protein